MRSGRGMEAKKDCGLLLLFQGEERQAAELLHLGAVCLAVHTLTEVQHSAADPSTPVRDVQGPGPLHGAVGGGCDSKRAGEKGINARNESLRLCALFRLQRMNIWDLQGTGTLVLHLHLLWRHFNRLLTSASSEPLPPQ